VKENGTSELRSCAAAERMKTFLRKHYRRSVKSLVRRSFPLLQRLGIHITLNHFYYPIPDTRTLPEELWTRRSQLPGIDLRASAQLELLREFSNAFKAEYERLPRDRTENVHQYFVRNKSFGSVDGEIFYCMTRHFKPRRILEIGSGHSTCLAAQALLKNSSEGSAGELIACEPYPKEFLRRGFPGLHRLIEKKVQDVPLAEFEALGPNDILFIDSSHVLKIGSDVQFEFLEILPRLKPECSSTCMTFFCPPNTQRTGCCKNRNSGPSSICCRRFSRSMRASKFCGPEASCI
jgi:hypothetical protein